VSSGGNGPRRAVITGWDVVSPFGVGRKAFSTGLWGGQRPAIRQVGAGDAQDCLVPGFSPREALGRKGTRSMDRVTGLAVTAVGQLIENPGGAGPLGLAEDTGLVLGTTTGSAQSIMDFTRSSLTAERPFYVDPGVIPNVVMNCAAGQCAIWYRLKGPNATIAAGRTAGLMALRYQQRLLASGRATTMICGAAEECSTARSWLECHSRDPAQKSIVLGEGCGVLLVRNAATDAPDDGEPLAELLSVQTRVFHDDPREAVVAAVRALTDAGTDPADVWAVSASQAPGAAGEQEREVLAELFGEAALNRLPALPFGDTGAASAVFQVASVLSAAGRLPTADRPLALVSSVDRDGTAAVALLRLG
jgi:3-oxoacyl-[acyl-carrier-protein] synthase II